MNIFTRKPAVADRADDTALKIFIR